MTIKDLKSLGELKKVGFIVPSSNTALEHLTAAMAGPLNDLVSFHFGRLLVQTIDLDSKSLNQFDIGKLLSATQLLNDGNLDAILWNGTSGSWSGKGLQAELTLADEMEGLTGLPTSTSTLAQVEVLKKYNIKRFALAVPYVDGPTKALIKFYDGIGFQVVSSAKLDESQNVKFADMSLDRIRQLLRDADTPDAECIIIPCTNFPAALVVEEMEAELGKPIFDSIIVTLWKALKLVQINVPLFSWGMLLKDHETLSKFERIMENLLKNCGASRTTFRMDNAKLNCHCDTICAEAVADGIKRFSPNSSLNQRALSTVQWIENTHEILVQEDCAHAAAKPPEALMTVYGVKAQMLAPLLSEGKVFAWISVHHVGTTRVWAESDIKALKQAVLDVETVLK